MVRSGTRISFTARHMGKTKLGLYVIVLVVVALVVTASLILAYSKAHAPIPKDDENVLALSDDRTSIYIVVEPLEGVSSEFSTLYHEDESVLDLLYRLHNEDSDFTFGVEESDFGPYISSVNGYAVSNEQREVWKLIINGMNVQGGIETLTVSPGDVMTLTLERF